MSAYDSIHSNGQFWYGNSTIFQVFYMYTPKVKEGS
jgi:hypothetical protein